MKINIVGAGVGGLTVGCYLQMCGFETEIFEKQPTSGGLCTSWKRGEYTFDGCIQWLLGSAGGSAFYKLWSELLDMESIQFISHESRFHIELKNIHDRHGSPVFILYTNINRLEAYLLDIAPEDSSQIKRLTGFIRKLQQYDLPPAVDKVVSLMSLKEKMGMMKHLPLLFLMLKWKGITNKSFAQTLQNPFLKEAFSLLFDGEELSLLLLTVPLASYDTQSAGYPLGGSYKFAQRFEEKYLSLGGKIRFNASVSKILVENDSTKGLLLADGTHHFSDICISAADWNYTFFEALEGNYTNKTILSLREQKKLKIYYSIFMVSLGLSRTFENAPQISRFPLKENIVSPDGTEFERLEVHIYNYDPTLAPKGKTVVSVSFYTTSGDYWIHLRNSNKEAYNKIKNEFAHTIVEAFDEKFGNIKNHIEEMNVTTPATYHRYTGNYRGSVQGWLPEKNLMTTNTIKPDLRGLHNFYFCGHWSQPGGGLPIAIKSGRDVAQMICKKWKVPFTPDFRK
ncbi:MAG: NAD(P)/FAD-dependent oxidoreductase [Bacteroidota bacterium]